MEKIAFRKLLFKVAFCSMACDGHIDDREVEEMKSMDKNTSFFHDIDLSNELSSMIGDLDKNGVKIISELFLTIKEETLNTIQELLILEVALRIINADDKHDDNELKFIHLLRAKLTLYDETIYDRFGNVGILNANKSSSHIQLTRKKNSFPESIVLPDISEIKKIDFNFKGDDQD